MCYHTNMNNAKVNFEQNLAAIESEATRCGKEYIYVLCAEKVTALIKNKGPEYDLLIEEWKQQNSTNEPSNDDLIALEYMRVLADTEYVDQTMQSLMRNVATPIIGRWLLVDDVRNKPNVEAVARTPSVAKRLLEGIIWDGVMLDHDLDAEETGYDIINWALANGCLPKRVEIITDNIYGRENMRRVLWDNEYETTDGRTFFKLVD